MGQFKALFKKEINAYFKSYFAYAIVFVYLFSSICTAFYFGAYLSAHDEALYSLFYAQPIILLILLPAITMKIWSEEYRSGTAEFLLTLPINPYISVFAKFCAAFCLCFVMSLLFLPFIFYSAEWLFLDWGNICSSFLGLWCLMAFLCALGCFISSLSKNVVVSYLFSVLFIAIWVYTPQSGLYESYNNFLFGEVGFPDFLYFILLMLTFLLMNGLVAEFRRSIQKYKVVKFTSFVLFLLAFIMAINFVLQKLIVYKFDMTTSRFYTLNRETQKVIDRVYKPINIDVYAAKDLVHYNKEYFYHYQRVKRFLRKYEKLSDGMIRINVTEVEPFSDLEANILDNGLFFNVNKDGIKEYFGALVRDENKKGVIIKQFLPQRKLFLEQDINKSLIRLNRSSVAKNIGIYFDITQNLDEFEGFVLNLENDYNVLNISSDIYEISTDIDMLILINPKKLPRTFLYAVDQFVMRGGKLLIFADFYTNKQAELTNLSDVDILPLLEQYYFSWNDQLIDEGILLPEYKVANKDIGLYKALSFKFSNLGMKITPFIKTEDGYIGALIKGVLPSMFGQSPYVDLDVSLEASKHNDVSIGEASVAVIGDVDFIEDYMWLDERSPDINPYSVISKKDNIDALRRFIDMMLGNEIYNRQPFHQYKNPYDIAYQIDKEVYDKYAFKLKQIDEQIEQKRTVLYLASGQNIDKMASMMQIDAAGKEIAGLEKQKDSLIYKVKQDYLNKIHRMMFVQIFFLPLLSAFLMWIFMMLRLYIYRRKMRELGYEK